jgi:sulfide dehydrogenase cytochrome subunit
MRVEFRSKRGLLLVGVICGLVACVGQVPVVEPTPPAPKGRPALMRGASAEMLAANCFGCHGPQGRSLAPAIPSLAGLPETYFIELMQAYQYGGRYSSVMGRIALAYDAGEIRRMADYFSAQTPRRHVQSVYPSQIREGRELHRRYCHECHGDLQTPPKPDAVTLNGQWEAYLRWTLQDYLVGINRSSAGMSEALSDLMRQQGSEGLEALIRYYGSGRP